jgi:hypothetical protein
MEQNKWYIKTNSLLKIHFPSPLTQNHWVVEEKEAKAIYAIPLEGVLMILISIRTTTKSLLFEKILGKTAASIDQLETILAYLLDKLMVFRVPDSSATDPYFSVAQSWELAGWSMAAHYHLFTKDAPYLDYAQQEQSIDHVSKKMHTYHSQKPDIERCKRYVDNLGSQPLPTMENLLYTYGITGKT